MLTRKPYAGIDGAVNFILRAPATVKIQPRPDQWQFISEINQAWNQGAKHVVGVASTGFGKTVCLSQLVEDNRGAACVVAHRQELVGQISMMLARYGVRHNIIAAQATVRAIAAEHVREFGQCYYTPSSLVGVASVDTLVRAEVDAAWLAQVTLVITDEGHHVVIGNKWHAALQRFPNARGLLPTATPSRADGKGLGTPELGGSGIADAMVLGPPMRWLIDNGFLTPYRVICVESDLKLLESQVSASGDYSPQTLKDAAKKSRIVGDVVREYLRWARGLRHITFSTDTDTAAAMTTAYRAAGVRAECLTGKTHDHLRRDIIKRFERGDLEEIVAVDIISEGFDLPAIEAVSFARPSMSLGVVWQQFGRALRTFEGKTQALIIDHVGNVINPAIGLPDRPRVWSLANRDSRKKKENDAIPMRVCVECYEPYERTYRECPHCGHYPEPASRAAPQSVDGDLAEMSPELLAKLRGDLDQAAYTLDEERARLVASRAPHVAVMAGVKHHAERLDTLAQLRQTMADWGGRRFARGDTDSMMQREFFLRFGVDVITAQALKRAEAQALLDRIVNSV
jgi:superfamily II DNA or RNA helicase